MGDVLSEYGYATACVGKWGDRSSNLAFMKAAHQRELSPRRWGDSYSEAADPRPYVVNADSAARAHSGTAKLIIRNAGRFDDACPR